MNGAASKITACLVGMVVGAVLVLAAGTVGATRADASSIVVAAKCQTDESIKGHPCFWDARHQGNGEGHSFRRSMNGTIVRVSHRRAHCMVRPHVPGSCPR